MLLGTKTVGLLLAAVKFACFCAVELLSVSEVMLAHVFGFKRPFVGLKVACFSLGRPADPRRTGSIWKWYIFCADGF